MQSKGQPIIFFYLLSMTGMVFISPMSLSVCKQARRCGGWARDERSWCEGSPTSVHGYRDGILPPPPLLLLLMRMVVVRWREGFYGGDEEGWCIHLVFVTSRHFAISRWRSADFLKCPQLQLLASDRSDSGPVDTLSTPACRRSSKIARYSCSKLLEYASMLGMCVGRGMPGVRGESMGEDGKLCIHHKRQR